MNFRVLLNFNRDRNISAPGQSNKLAQWWREHLQHEWQEWQEWREHWHGEKSSGPDDHSFGHSFGRKLLLGRDATATKGATKVVHAVLRHLQTAPGLAVGSRDSGARLAFHAGGETQGARRS